MFKCFMLGQFSIICMTPGSFRFMHSFSTSFDKERDLRVLSPSPVKFFSFVITRVSTLSRMVREERDRIPSSEKKTKK